MAEICEPGAPNVLVDSERAELLRRTEALAQIDGPDALVAGALFRLIRKVQADEFTSRATFADHRQNAGRWVCRRSQTRCDDLQVLDFMRVDPVTIEVELTIAAAISRFTEYGLTEAPVVDSRNVYRGMLTTAELLRCVLGAQSRLQRVTKAARQDVRPVRPETRIRRLPQRFLHDGLDQLPVVYGRCLVGVIQLSDLLAANETAVGDEAAEDEA